MQNEVPSPATRFRAIGYTRARQGLPLDAFDRALPKPGPYDMLVHIVSSSLNPLDYKLAELNFLGRTPPVGLGFDVAGIVVARGDAVTEFAIGDAVFGMAPTNQDGAWAAGGAGGYVLMPEFMTAPIPEQLDFVEAGTLGVCYLSAYLALADMLDPGATVYIPGGGGGVGHLAIQKAKALGGGTIISSGGNAQSRALATASGANHVFDYRHDDIAQEVARLTQGRGVDLVFDATYSEDSFVATSNMVRAGGRWVVLGVGPGKTSRQAETESPVAKDAGDQERSTRQRQSAALFLRSDRAGRCRQGTFEASYPGCGRKCRSQNTPPAYQRNHPVRAGRDQCRTCRHEGRT